MVSAVPYIFCTDARFVDKTLVAMRSLAITNPRRITCGLVYRGDFRKVDRARFETLAARHDFRLIIAELADSDLPGYLPAHRNITVTTYIKPLLPEMFAGYDRLIYLDGDLIVNGDLSELETTDLDGNLLAAVAEPIAERIGTLSLTDYFNSGVLVLNARLWREERVKDAVFSFVRESPHLLRYAEQCALNITAHRRVKLLDPKFNWLLNRAEPIRAESFDRTLIFHFNGELKPWKRLSLTRLWRRPELRARYLRNFIHHRRLWYYYAVERRVPISRDQLFAPVTLREHLRFWALSRLGR